MRPRTFFWALLGITAAVIVVAGGALVWGAGRLSAQKNQLTTRQVDLEFAQERLNQLLTLKKNYDAAAPKLDIITKALPATKEQSTVILQLEGAASASGLNLASITFNADPKPSNLSQTVPDGVFYSLPVTLKLTGNYQQLQAFLNRIEHLSRFNSVSTLSLAKGSSDRTFLSIGLTINIFLKP